MSQPKLTNKLTDIAKILGTSFSSADLLRAKDSWETIYRYWSNLNNEKEREGFGSRTVRVLDFDVIYPAIWYVNAPTTTIHGVNDSVFPMTSKFIFEHTKSAFTIPPGAEVELTQFLNDLLSKHQLIEHRVISKWQEIKPHVENENVTSADTRGLIASLRNNHAELLDDIEELIINGEKLDRLQSILNHEYFIPWEHLVEENDFVNSQEIVDIWHRFNEERKTFTVNNYFDAINIVSYYSLLETQVNSPRREYIPLLASGTNIVQSYSEFPSRIQNLEIYLSDDIRPVSPQYLTFATAVEMHAEYDLNILSTIISEGLRSGDVLAQEWRKLRDEIRNSLFQQREKIEELAIEDFIRFPAFRSFRMAYHRWYEHLMDGVGEVFVNVTRSDRLIRNNFGSALKRIVKDLHHIPQSESPSEIATSRFDEPQWDRAIANIDEHLLLQSREVPTFRKKTSMVSALRSAEIISEFVTTTRADGSEAESIDEASDLVIRISVHLKHINKELFKWESRPMDSSELCSWSHSIDLETFLDLARNFLQGYEEPNEVAKVVYFSDDSRKEFMIPILNSTEDWLTGFDMMSQLEYLRIDTTSCTVFFDILPVDSTMAPEIAISLGASNNWSKVASLFEQTSVTSFDQGIVFELMREYSSNFRDTNWIEKMIKNNPIGMYRINAA
jgi:hypothetical protein